MVHRGRPVQRRVRCESVRKNGDEQILPTGQKAVQMQGCGRASFLLNGRSGEGKT